MVFAQAQDNDNPVKWSYSAKALENNQFELTYSAKILKGWHVYALKVSNDPKFIGPIPTSVSLTPDNKNFKVVSNVKDTKYITHYDPNFDAD